MLEHSVALNYGKQSVRERELLRIRRNIDAGQWEQIEVDVSFHPPARSADIQVPEAERKIERLFRIVNQRRGGIERAA